MVQFARQFPDHAEVAELVTRVSWSHVYTLLAIKSDDARDFYAAEAAVKRLSVRELKKAISRKAYERRKIANSQIPEDPPSRATRSATHCDAPDRVSPPAVRSLRHTADASAGRDRDYRSASCGCSGKGSVSNTLSHFEPRADWDEMTS